MDAFFNVSKLVGIIATPTNLLVILLVGALVASRFQRFHGLGSRLAPIAGGAVGSVRIEDRFEVTLGEAAERVTYAAALARRYPGAKVLASGGQAFDNGSGRSEADGMSELLVQLGVAPEQILRESQSRTTAENAAFVAQQTGSERWLLVTSAFHLPRAIATFRNSGVDVIAAPTDWRVGDDSEPLLFSASDNLKKVDLAGREYLGLLAYWLGGRTSELFPGPVQGGLCG